LRVALVHKRIDLKGGTEKDFHRTAEGLRDLGHEVHLFCSEYGVPAPKGTVGHRILVLPLGRTARLWSGALLPATMIQKPEYDIIVSFGRIRCGGGTHKGFLERLARESGSFRGLWQNLSIYHRSVLNIERRQFHNLQTRKIIAVSHEVKRDICDHYSVPEEKIAVLYNGVDEERFHPLRREQFRSVIRSQWGIPLSAQVVLFVGSGFLRKGLDRLMSIWNRPKLADVHLMVVGDDARLRSYKTRADRVAGSRIVFAGHQDDIEKYYAAADLVALPSIQEAFGNVVVEALASGVPVVVSRGVGAAEVLTGTLAGGIVDHPEDPTELEAKVLLLLERAGDPRWAEEARTIAQRYSWQNHFQKLEALLIETAKLH